jgi:hypothetical protein
LSSAGELKEKLGDAALPEPITTRYLATRVRCNSSSEPRPEVSETNFDLSEADDSESKEVSPRSRQPSKVMTIKAGKTIAPFDFPENLLVIDLKNITHLHIASQGFRAMI